MRLQLLQFQRKLLLQREPGPDFCRFIFPQRILIAELKQNECRLFAFIGRERVNKVDNGVSHAHPRLIKTKFRRYSGEYERGLGGRQGRKTTKSLIAPLHNGSRCGSTTATGRWTSPNTDCTSPQP
jgi:hypothetical protein